MKKTNIIIAAIIAIILIALSLYFILQQPQSRDINRSSIPQLSPAQIDSTGTPSNL